jgi:DNA-binding GntR family transcriptional regulator
MSYLQKKPSAVSGDHQSTGDELTPSAAREGGVSLREKRTGRGEKLSLKDLCAAIRREIVSRNFPPGMKLSEQILCNRWKVSRTPIREALRHLESEGFISSIKHKGFVVTSLSMHDVEEIYTIMMNLDSLAGRLATPTLVNESAKLKALRTLCQEMKALCEKRDIEGYTIKNLEFHSIIFRSSENSWMRKILENLHSHTNRFILNAIYIPRRIEKSVQEHLEILHCIEQGDEKGVEKAISAHFSKSLNDLRIEIDRINHDGDRSLKRP